MKASAALLGLSLTLPATALAEPQCTPLKLEHWVNACFTGPRLALDATAFLAPVPEPLAGPLCGIEPTVALDLDLDRLLAPEAGTATASSDGDPADPFPSPNPRRSSALPAGAAVPSAG